MYSGSLVSNLVLLLVGRRGAAQFEFAIIGAQKAGTTGLRNALALDHPSTCVPSEHSALACARAAAPCEYHRLESAGFRRAPDWAEVARWTEAACANKTAPYARGFADPFLVYRAPELAPGVRALLPALRLIVALREPARRAFSQYQMDAAVCAGALRGACAPRAPASFDALVARELPPLLGARPRRRSKRDVLARGLYAEQLGALLRAPFAAERVFVVVSERLFAGAAAAAAVHDALYAFLGVGPRPRGGATAAAAAINRGVAATNETLSDAAVARLHALYANSTRALYADALLGETVFEWECWYAARGVSGGAAPPSPPLCRLAADGPAATAGGAAAAAPARGAGFAREPRRCWRDAAEAARALAACAARSALVVESPG